MSYPVLLRYQTWCEFHVTETPCLICLEIRILKLQRHDSDQKWLPQKSADSSIHSHENVFLCLWCAPFPETPKDRVLGEKKRYIPNSYILYKPQLDHMVSRSYKPQATQKSEHLSCKLYICTSRMCNDV